MNKQYAATLPFLAPTLLELSSITTQVSPESLKHRIFVLPKAKHQIPPRPNSKTDKKTQRTLDIDYSVRGIPSFLAEQGIPCVTPRDFAPHPNASRKLQPKHSRKRLGTSLDNLHLPLFNL